jgi:hypothetical protein
MNLRRLGSGEVIAGVSAILLVGLTFLDWFGSKSSAESLGLFSVSRSAWEALDYIPFVLLVTSVAALVVVVFRLASIDRRAMAAVNAVVAMLGAGSALLILYRIVDPPEFGTIGTSFGLHTVEGTVKLPMFLALAAAMGIVLGSCLALREGRSSSAA